MTLTTGITVKINADCYQKIMHWVNMSDFEVSGFGKVQSINGVLVVTSVVLLKQENTSGSTDIEGEDIAKAMYELRNEPGSLNFWWHSHVDMAVFWSGTDDEAIESIGTNGWVLASVFNKKNEVRTIYYQKESTQFPSITIDDIETTISYELTEVQKSELTEEYNRKVTNKKSFVTSTYNPSWNKSINLPPWLDYTKDNKKEETTKEKSLEDNVAGYEFSERHWDDDIIPPYKSYAQSVSQHKRLAQEFLDKRNRKRKKKNR